MLKFKKKLVNSFINLSNDSDNRSTVDGPSNFHQQKSQKYLLSCKYYVEFHLRLLSMCYHNHVEALDGMQINSFN